ncbi:hypothetical protein MCOR30_006493 [Pyricularia oryzae]|nr:hypothetical protein MCOR30_006493 [Pyricularia oryzae]
MTHEPMPTHHQVRPSHWPYRPKSASERDCELSSWVLSSTCVRFSLCNRLVGLHALVAPTHVESQAPRTREVGCQGRILDELPRPIKTRNLQLMSGSDREVLQRQLINAASLPDYCKPAI